MSTVPPQPPTQPPAAPAAPGQVPPPGTLPKLPQTIFNLEKRGNEDKPTTKDDPGARRRRA